ncbi:hypothetical protein CL654_00355 [bacterium]|nr:hypothetical protein [bacterium]|tara:strand:+ start:9447 stop:10547 length:1101 start_codon:yes stop_codon:yes gene_type:complete
MFELLVFIIILSILVLSHEFGHFWVAKKSGMRVDEFGFGFPPKLWGKKYGETEYTINLIPFGGFVKIYGEDDPNPEYQGGGRKFASKSKWAQAAVIVAGVAFNFILAWLLFSIGFMIGFPTPLTEDTIGIVENPQVLITNVFNESPAEVADLRIGDAVLALSQGGRRIDVQDPSQVSEFVSNSGVGEIAFRILRDGKEEVVTITPAQGILEGRQAIGISLESIGLVSLPPHIALWEGLKKTGQFIWLTVFGFFGIIKDALVGQAGFETISGPIGIYSLVGQAQTLGFTYLLGFTALISISLGIINLVPFPALDGGRLLFLIIEAVKGSPIKPQVANTLNYVGFGILLLLMVLVSYGDLLKIGVIGS